ncbi:hypothetical protein Zmor_015563 [Zophobas morio]|uniref:Uncharacterized protein n=1 Tax=Zophobas morio TaxID=2755281 RepID=A0AA38IHC0_9CUCU|nr:hypothetical protein Zmor_015563 [Zophobas morio]
MSKFLSEAGDERYLLIKAAIITEINGSCRKGELQSLLTENIITEEQLVRNNRLGSIRLGINRRLRKIF